MTGPAPTSGVGEDLFGTDDIETVDGAGADKSPVVEDVVDRAARTSAATGSDGLPLDVEPRTEPGAGAAMDTAGHDPLDLERVDRVRSDDHDSARVLDAGRIDSVHAVGAGQAVATVGVSGQISGQGTEIHQQAEREERPERSQDVASRHRDDSNQQPPVQEPLAEPERLIIPRWLKVLTALFSFFIVAAVAFAIFEPIQVLPRMRLAPGYSMIDQDGERFTSETARGDIVVYAFTSLDCATVCDDIDDTMAEIGARVRDDVDFGEIDFRLVSVVLDAGQDPAALANVASPASDDVAWSWISSDAETMSTVVGAGFRRFLDASDLDDVRFDPGFVIVDGNGVVRGDYRYQTLADDAEKLVRHLDILAGELRHANGPAGAAYEAAHLFLCYP